jgi:hypothetical protein
MPSTETKELFPKNSVTEETLRQLAKLRVKAGAISANFTIEGEEWVLTTEWPVLGEKT